MARDVAIIGMACIFPKAPDLAAFWKNVRDGVDAITDVPATRWDPRFYDPASSAPDRLYARRGGFIDEYAHFDAAAFGIMPATAMGTEPEQLLTLQVAADALADAGYAERAFARDKTSVIVGRGHYVGPGMARVVNITRGAQQLIDSLRTLVPDLRDDQLAAIKNDFQMRCGPFGADTAIGIVPNLLASRVANRLDLRGSAYTLDAACASALVAVDHACRELADGRADVALAGGVHLCHDVTFWSVFSQLGALSRRQQIRPFDRDADGLLIGEGIGMFVLKRLADAQRADDRIYAIIRGTGIASDGRDASLMTPRVDGQVLALTRAWEVAGLDPASVGLVEAHGTATTAGDAAELATLARVFGAPTAGGERLPLGSVKSMIGHTMPAAGAAGLIKAALAVFHGVRPPTLHCDDPHALLAATRFRTLAAAEPWDAPTRRAAVNAFGFGGINAHVIVDAPQSPRREPRPSRPAPAPAPDAIVFAAPSQRALVDAVRAGRGGGEGPWRLAVFEPTPKKVASAIAAVEAGRRRHGRDGIYFAPGGLVAEGGKVAFLFPGVEAAFAPQVADIAEHFGIDPPDLRATDLEHQGMQVIALGRFLERVTAELKMRPDMLAGHSVGEWSGMIAAAMFEDASIADFLAALTPGTLRVAEVTYVAVGAGAAKVSGLIRDLPDVIVSHDNCLHQSIVCGPDAAIEVLTQRLREGRILFEVLPFRSGFHSPALANHVDFYRERLATLKLKAPARPLWSATTCAPYPADPARIAALFVDHLVQPVRFRGLISAMYEAGARVFVQVGTGSLAAFVDDVLADRPHLALSLVAPRRAGMDQLRRACAAAFVEGADVDLARLGLVPPSAGRQTAIPLELGVPLIRLDLQPLQTAAPARPLAQAGQDPVYAAFAEGMREMADAHESVLRAFSARPLAVSKPSRPSVPAAATVATVASATTGSLAFSIEAWPELVDHCLLPQPPAWPALADRGPAVPMTMSIALLMEAAERFDPQRTPVAVEGVLASSWLYVEPASQKALICTRSGADRIHVRIEGFVEGTVIMADRYPDPPPPATEELVDLRAFPVPVDAIYRDGWLFHGPQYQGVVTVDAHGSNGVRGTLRALPAKGALLDCAGQLYGLWVLASVPTDQMAMPVKIGRVDFYGPDPAPGTLVDCTVYVRHVGRREIRADLELRQGRRVYARVTAWEDWRFETGGGIYEVMRQPARHLLATVDPAGFTVVADPGWRSATVEFLARRFLSYQEREAMGGGKRVQRQRDWLYGRIAAKDAVRHLLWLQGGAPMFPIEVGVESDSQGRPHVHGPFPNDIRVSIAHRAGIACAIAAEGKDPGIDIEAIEPRGDGFATIAFAAEELRLLPADDDEWRTRLWAAKEAAGKANGTGLAGNPRGLVLAAVERERMLVDGRRIQTRKFGDNIIAWTVQ